MVTLPLAWLVSVLTIIAAYALAQSTRTPFPARLFLCTFLLTVAAIGLLLGFRLSFGSSWAARLQPLFAVMVAPAAYLGFLALTQNTTSWRQALQWNAVPVVLAQAAILAPIPISEDVFVLGITSTYLFRTATLLRYGADDFVHVPAHAMRLVRSAIYATILLLGMMAATDGLIVAAGLFAGDAFILRFLTGVSGIFTAFVCVVALVGAPMVLRGAKSGETRTGEPNDRDRALMAALGALMTEKRL